MNDSERFVSITNEEMHDLLETSTPENTRKRDKWAMNILSTWNTWRKKQWAENGGACIVLRDFDEMCKEDLDFVLQEFIPSIRKEDKSEYPPSSLRSIVSGIFSHFRRVLNRHWDFFKDVEFSKSRAVLDAKMRQLTRAGHCGVRRKAEPISQKMEDTMWSSGILGDDNPKKLLHTVLYMLGVHFALRSRSEHRALRFGKNSQLQLLVKDGVECLQYREDCSKTRQGGLKDRFVEPKEGIVFSDGLVDSKRDLVLLYKKYVSHRPTNTKTDAFYLRPLANPKGDIWYCDQAVGVNMIAQVVKNLTSNIDSSGYFTNHSLRRTCVSRLNQAGIPIEGVKKKTGHRTTEGVMSYDVVSEAQLSAQSAAIYGVTNVENAKSTSKTSFQDQSSVKGLLEGASFHNCSINFNIYN